MTLLYTFSNNCCLLENTECISPPSMIRCLDQEKKVSGDSLLSLDRSPLAQCPAACVQEREVKSNY